MSVRCRNSAGAFLFIALAGCSDKDITTYRVPKDPGSVVAAAPAPAAGEASPSTPGLRWQAPPGWQAQAAGGMRAASFLGPGPEGAAADISVVTFAGAGGDLLANINRWRGQLQLAPIDTGQLASEIGGLDLPAGHFTTADLRGEPVSGKPAMRILGALLEQPGRVWFFKMMGPETAVEAQKDAFLAFLKSVAPGEGGAVAPDIGQGGANPAANTNDLPHGSFAVAPTGAASQPSLEWQAPADWQPMAVSAMRKGSYAVSRGSAKADMSITAFPGDVGGLAANVNRWRGQLGLDPVDEGAVGSVTEPLNVNGLQFTVVDFSGDAPGGRQRILAALAGWQGATWFFKLTGPDALVAEEKTKFIALLKTVHPR